MSKTIAIIGAGPGVGMAIADRFGREGFNVALLSRNKEKLDTLVSQLQRRDITAAAFPADVMDRTGLTEALHRVVNHFGGIDVLEYGPTPAMASIRTVTTTDVDAANLQFAFNVLGAITAVQTVLPAMQARKDGAILFTTAVSAQHPVNMTANFGIAAGAQLNYARLLHSNLKGDNIYAGIVSIAGLVAPTEEEGKKRAENFPSGLPVITAEEVADQHWALYTKRDKCEAIIGDLEKLSVMGLLK